MSLEASLVNSLTTKWGNTCGNHAHAQQNQTTDAATNEQERLSGGGGGGSHSCVLPPAFPTEPSKGSCSGSLGRAISFRHKICVFCFFFWLRGPRDEEGSPPFRTTQKEKIGQFERSFFRIKTQNDLKSFPNAPSQSKTKISSGLQNGMIIIIFLATIVARITLPGGWGQRQQAAVLWAGPSPGVTGGHRGPRAAPSPPTSTRTRGLGSGGRGPPGRGQLAGTCRGRSQARARGARNLTPTELGSARPQGWGLRTVARTGRRAGREAAGLGAGFPRRAHPSPPAR